MKHICPRCQEQSNCLHDCMFPESVMCYACINLEFYEAENERLHEKTPSNN